MIQISNHIYINPIQITYIEPASFHPNDGDSLIHLSDNTEHRVAGNVEYWRDRIREGIQDLHDDGVN